MWKIVLFLYFCSRHATAQIDGYETVTGNFSCDRIQQLVLRTERVGTIQSPCYDGVRTDYPKELTSGFKLINITFGNALVVGYRLTIRDFQLAASDRLYMGPTTRKDGSNTLAQRNVTFTSNSTTDGLIYVQVVEDGPIAEVLDLSGNNQYLLENYETVFLDFYTVDDTFGGRGFLIDYEADLNDCLKTGDDVFCKNGGSCTKTGFNTATCTCTSAWKGSNCEEDVDECDTTDPKHDCDTNADCDNTPGTFTCTCRSGYTGSGKECTDINECSDGINTHECNLTGACSNKDGGYDCTCNEGYEGGIGGPCTNIDECATNTDDCDTNADCSDIDGSHVCNCKTFYTGNGTFCTDLDECAIGTDECGDTGTCVNKIGGYNCSCFAGFEGGVDAACTDIDECSDPNICDPNADCANEVGSFRCTCKSGYTGTDVCTDVNECDVGNDDCDDNADCENTDGSFNCTCKSGYTGTGKDCADVNECELDTDNCHDDATCTNDDGGFSCACKQGFTGDGFTCADNDECALNSDNCHANANCGNIAGSFTCTCKTGYTGNGIDCTDENECSGTSPCDSNASCTNNDGSFSCACNSGFNGDGFTCTDDNECAAAADNNCDSNAECRNIPGSFNCVCNTGYAGSGVECEDINECAIASDNDCDNSERATCTNTGGSFACSCKKGYAGDGKECKDVDECADPTSNTCELPVSTCENLIGSFQCICNEPEYRGEPDKCEYYCLHNTTCDPTVTVNSYIEVPLFWDGSTPYPVFDETFWKFNYSVFKGIKFTMLAYNTEIRDDFLSLYSGSSADIDKEIAAISGSIGNLYNEKERVVSSGFIQPPGSAVTAFLDLGSENPELILSSGDILVAFTSDRLNSSTGFKIQYFYDKQDCPATSPCLNGGTCEDRSFTYQCINCPGYQGINCEIDIDECALTGTDFPCHADANCENTDGSYNCACKTDFIGDGKTCNPHIQLDNLMVTKTTTSLSINFDVTAKWRSAQYIETYTISIVSTDGSFARTYDVNTTSLLTQPLEVNGLKTFTRYNVSISIKTTGSSFGTSVVTNNVKWQILVTAESNAGTPTSPRVPTVKRDRATFAWTGPEEEGFGAVISYEVCWAVSSSTQRNIDIATLRGLSHDFRCLIIDNTITSITLTELTQYVELVFKVRAYSSIGPSNYSTSVSAFTGEICPSWEVFSTRVQCPHREGLMESEGFPTERTTSDNNQVFQYWQFDITSFTKFRQNIKYFHTVIKESSFDYGFGNIDITDHDTEKENIVGELTGQVPAGPRAAITKDTSDPTQNTLWQAFISDRTRKMDGFQVEIEIDGNNCDSSPCLHGGICTDGEFSYTCDCIATDWTGKSCEQPHVKPSVTCITGKRSVDVSFSVQNQWAQDETVIGGYTISINDGTTSNSMTKVLGDSTASFTGLSPFRDHTVSITVSTSLRNNAVYNTNSIVCKTQEDLPTAPQAVSVTPGVKSLEVSWTPPIELNGNVQYTVTYTSTDHETYSEALTTLESPAQSTTGYTISGLKDYRTYDVVVKAMTGAGPTLADAVSARTSPGAPYAFTSVNVTVITSNSARVEWTTATGVFIGPTTITISAMSERHGPVTKDVTAGTTTNLEGLEEGLIYNFTLTASTGTAPDQTIMQNNVNTAEIAPGAPATFAYDEDTATLSWTPPPLLEQNGEIDGYVITAVTPIPGFTEETVGPAVRTLVLTGLPAFTPYSVKIQAINGAGNGEAKTLEFVTKEEEPDIPTAVTTGTVTSTSIEITWVAQTPAVGQTTYTVTYTDGTTPISVDLATTSIVISDLTPDTEYTITVIAKTNAGSSDATDPLVIKTSEDIPTAVRDLSASFSISDYEISVNWNAPVPTNGVIRKYNVKWSAGSQSGDEDVLITSATITSVVLSETDYLINVTAFTSIGEGPSNQVTLTTPVLVPGVPQGVTFADITSTSAVVIVTPPSNTEISVVEYAITVDQDTDDCQAFNDENCLENDRKVFTATSDNRYPIDGLKSFRKHLITVSAASLGGEGELSGKFELSTLAGIPNAVTIVGTESNPGEITVTFNAGTPFTGPASYIVVLESSSGITLQTTVPETSQQTNITATITGVQDNTEYTVTITATVEGSSGGSTGSGTGVTATSTPTSPTFTITRDSSTQFTITVEGVPGATSYRALVIETDCTDCTAQATTSTETSFTISGLKEFTAYDISVFAVSSFGTSAGTTTSARTRAGTPTLKDDAYKPTISNNSDPDTYSPTTTITVNNLCSNKADVFDETTGTITAVFYLVRQNTSTEGQSTTRFWAEAFTQANSQSYRSFTVQCSGGSRKKRQVVGNGVVIGADDSCSTSDTNTECNGPLKSDTAYTITACGANEEDNFVCTQPSAAVKTQPSNSRGLTAGEIAAIVICSILLLILIILLIVYCVKRRRSRTGKHRVAKTGQQNPTFDSTKSQQKYQVDPAAEPQTQYSEPAV